MDSSQAWTQLGIFRTVFHITSDHPISTFRTLVALWSFSKGEQHQPSTVHTAYSAIVYSAKSDIVPTLSHM